MVTGVGIHAEGGSVALYDRNIFWELGRDVAVDEGDVLYILIAKLFLSLIAHG